MSMTYSNTTVADQYIPTVSLGMVTNYAKTADEPTMARLSNKTASIEQPEIVTYRCDSIKSVSTSFPVRNPSPVRDGVQYTIKIEDVDRITVGTETYDEPIAVWLTVKHTASDNWTNAKVASIVKRLLSACVKSQTTTGTKAAISDSDWRFEELMRSALVPSAD